ncbi:MAG: hypothetical protein GEV28_07165 [Actinophytocola sp.]|uniref:hypothetical protein n=1 Tax=Actinophytocola sp. TaxID=1872138 RepID=UPI001327C46F|nr:hypothetical protein [Actinophytocola sp.]MPZ80173.1 hypothetical protein [Actinophytocola sp.]
MTEEPVGRTVSRLGTARALVLLAAALSFGASALVCFVVLVFGPSVLDRPGLTGAVVFASAVFCLVVLVSAITASLLAVRAGTVRTAVGRGCGTLLAGVGTGLAALLLLISRNT